MAEKQIKAIIFDLDGVICHTDHYHFQAWNEIATELHIPFNEEINHRLRGVSRKESFEIILEKYSGTMSEEKKENYLTKKNEIYKRLLKNMSEKDVSDEVKETLEYLKKKGILLGIGSSSKNAKFILKQIGLFHMFDVICDGTMIEKSKPDPEVFLKAASMLGVLPEESAIVEDAKAGMIAGKQGGFYCIAISEATKCGLSHKSIQSFDAIKEIIS